MLHFYTVIIFIVIVTVITFTEIFNKLEIIVEIFHVFFLKFFNVLHVFRQVVWSILFVHSFINFG